MYLMDIKKEEYKLVFVDFKQKKTFLKQIKNAIKKLNNYFFRE